MWGGLPCSSLPSPISTPFCNSEESFIFAQILPRMAGNADGRVVSPRRPDASARRPYLESVQSVKSEVHLLWLRLAALGRLREVDP
jgi:hypothetical protein